MSDRESSNYVGYEYTEMVVDKDQVSYYIDGFENFGWELDDRFPNVVESNITGKRIVRLKRNRKIMNKAELTRLQRNFEDCMRQIRSLQSNKTSLATIVAIVIAIIGTAFMAGSVFAVTHEPPLILLCIVLAIPGFIGWLLPVFVYRKIVSMKTQELDHLIEKKRDELDEICEKGKKLLI